MTKSSPTEPRPPGGLAPLQTALLAAITTPFDLAAEGGWRTQTERYPEPAVAAVLPGATKPPAERLSTYNQQYWFRLFTVMQDEFPLLRHLLGADQLNVLTSAYLTAHPSRSPSLRDLSDDLCEFLAGDVPWNIEIVRECVRLERAFIVAFDAAELPPFTPDAADPSSALVARLSLQPHITLFEEHWELVASREQILGDIDDEIEVDPASACAQWAIHRVGKRVVTERLGPLQYRLLSAIGAATPLGAACDGLAAELSTEDLAFLGANVRGWFASWASRGWFVPA